MNLEWLLAYLLHISADNISYNFGYQIDIIIPTLFLCLASFPYLQIRDIFESANSVKSNYQKSQDSTLQYLQKINVPKSLQNKVRNWFNYNWEQQKTLSMSARIWNILL